MSDTTPKATKRKKNKSESTEPPKKYERAGAPTLYKPEYCEQIIEAGRRGESILEFACSVGVSRETVHAWKRNHPEFSDAFRQAKELCEAWFMKVGKHGLIGGEVSLKEGSPPKKINPGLWSFWMQCRFGWKPEGQRPDDDDDDNTLEFDFK